MHRVANSNTIMNTDRSDGTLRVARIAWAVGFVLLLAVIVVRLFTVDIVQGVAEEYLVGLGLPAAAALVSPPTFYYYLMVLRYSALAIFWLLPS